MDLKRQLGSEQGFTLIEVLVAATILVVALVPLMGIINQGTILSEQVQEKTAAMAVATDYMEKVKSFLPMTPADFTATNPQNPQDPKTLGDLYFTKDNPLKVSHNVQQNLSKDFWVYLTIDNPTPTSTPTVDGTYQFYDMTVTITVYWHDNWSKQQQSINLTTEMVGR